MWHKGFHISEFTEIKDIENVVDYCLFNYSQLFDFKYLKDFGCIINTSRDTKGDRKIKNYIQVIRVRSSGQPVGSCGYYFNIPENKVDLLIKQTRKHFLLNSFENKQGE
jgi:hypothetical protein